jgi:hypothetical protein
MLFVAMRITVSYSKRIKYIVNIRKSRPNNTDGVADDSKETK